MIRHVGWQGIGWRYTNKKKWEGEIFVRRIYEISIFGMKFRIYGMAF
jgi:hypothetical protein